MTGRAAPRSIVVLEPTDPGDVAPPADRRVMDQLGRAFIPELQLLQQGQVLEFRNSENELHSVRVDRDGSSRIPVFNVATAPFASYEFRFDTPGFYNVACDVHQEMRALILVTATPHATIAAEDGTFSFSNVTPGSYELTMHDAGRTVVRPVEVTGAPAEIIIAGN
ncbi:MAG: hypothetical protein EHM55_19395 [Acidobacteria bacterium]|nr:MAG: hypothetical protein EHM55_19395 [Acidobacteriota bacterium]